MSTKTDKLLADILDASQFIIDQTRHLSATEYAADRLLRQAVDRNFEILGEAVNTLRRVDANLVSNISDAGRIVDFRNLLIHGYAVIDDFQVWATITGSLPKLIQEVEAILSSDRDVK